ncbi:hypothetical protein G3480_01745 [Thiorhodococcus mannitoliphagus]|uniref:Lipoprotein n=1 Tax=Thiorhodococcus mannitoliphagus TaxID=329406 RepID=A0A6P1DMA6_9GAMM|nr:hypothetical protein [Thiorhodococcus mannitoliphagus]NEX19049.1 hypothetical protein [Thiorhodococcus mannitoliphagus]
MFRLVAIAAAASSLIAGCAFLPPNHLGGIATKVTPGEYGDRLCRHLDLEDYAGCVSEVLEYFETPHPNDLPPGHSTSGPIAVMFEEEVYTGHYDSAPPFAASFRVSNGVNACSASYNAGADSRDALFDVYCNDGRSGWADMILAMDGRNGIGKLALDDGSQANIVFGYLPLGQAEPYPYRP